MAINPNWPVIMEDWGPYWNANAGDIPLDRFVEVTDRSIGPTSSKRGKQYELDQAQAGEYSATLDNLDGSLDPLNASGPWFGHVQPYSPYRKRAQWPPTQNLLTQVQATGGDQGGYSTGTIPGGGAGIDVLSVADSSGGQIVSSGTAWQGGTVFQFSVPSGTVAPTRIVHTPQPGVIPGKTYTMQIQVRNVTASTTLQVKPFLGWYIPNGSSPNSFNYGSTVTLTGSTTAAWTQITVTATAPSNAAGIDAGVAIAATAGATCSIQVDGWQLEKGSSATSWVAPGVWYPLYAGFVERWPASWELGGTYGQVKPTSVDALALLSQVQLSDPLTEEINSHNPRFLYTLSDPQGVSNAADSTGNYPAASVAVSKYGAGSLTFGNSVTSTDVGGGYVGSSGSVVTINNSNPGANLVPNTATFLSLGAAGITGPADPTLWTRMIAFRYTGPLPSSRATLWSSMDKQRANGGPSGSHIYVQLFTDGKPELDIQGADGTSSQVYFGGATNCADGDWHLLIFGYSQSAQQLVLSQDGAAPFVYGSIPTNTTPTGLASDNLGGFVDITVGNGTYLNYKGDLAFAAEFPTLLSATDMTNLYNAWKSAFSGESSDARYSRILSYAGYNGTRFVETGLTTSVGSCNIQGQDAMSALQDVVATENGEHYVARDGTLTFRSRSSRYNAMTPVYTFGEHAGEFPYEECTLDYDPTHLANQVQVTQQSTSQIFAAQDLTSIANYFPRSLQRTNNASSGAEVQSAADYLLSRYKNPAVRVSTLKLHPSANTALWPVCLSLELGMRIRVMRRPFGGAAPIQVDCFIEQITVDMDDKGEAWWTLQCSPADLTPYGLFASWHSTLNASYASGVSAIVVTASADTTNPLEAQIGQGQQLVLGLGTANQETVTVLSVGPTSPGWTTATITLQSATTKSHSTNDVICEPLPSGVTSATAYDAVSQFDSVAFAY